MLSPRVLNGLNGWKTMLLKYFPVVLWLAFFSFETNSPDRRQIPSQSPAQFRILIEGDSPTSRLLREELRGWGFRMRKPIVFVDDASSPYDLRLIVTGDEASKSDSCTVSCTSTGTHKAHPTSSTCNTTASLHFVSAAGVATDGKFQFAETGAGSSPRAAAEPVGRKVAKRLSVMP